MRRYAAICEGDIVVPSIIDGSWVGSRFRLDKMQTTNIMIREQDI